jgi:hypothetical protein
LSNDIKNRYDPSKLFYESFLSISKSNQDKLVSPIYNSENDSYEWKVITINDGVIG